MAIEKIYTTVKRQAKIKRKKCVHVEDVVGEKTTRQGEERREQRRGNWRPRVERRNSEQNECWGDKDSLGVSVVLFGK